MVDRKQAELLEQYLILLRSDLDAAPPPELDPIVAELARKLKQERVARPGTNVKARVWQKALAQHRTISRNSVSQSIYPTGANYGLTMERKTRRTYPMTLAAAVTAVVVFVGIMLVIGQREKPSYATEITPQAETAAAQSTPTPEPQDDALITATPVPSNGVQAIRVAAAQVGETVTGTLDDSQPMMIFRYNIKEPSVIVAQAEASDFEPSLFYTVGNDVQTYGRIAMFASSPTDEGGMGTALPPVAGLMFNQEVRYVSDTPNPIWLPVGAGDVIHINVTSTTPRARGSFQLTTTSLQPILLNSGEDESFTFDEAHPFAYFAFSGKADEHFTLHFEGGATKNLIIFDTAQPHTSMNMLPSSTFSIDTLPISRRTDGTTGIIFEPENAADQETITVSLIRST